MSDNSYILIAEDEAFLSAVLSDKLRKEGFETTVANNGEEALAAMKKNTPALVLLDLMMPVKNGFDTLKEIREGDGWKGVPVIVLSNLGQEQDREEAKKLGANDFFVKAETDLEELIPIIKKHLNKKSG